MFTAKYGRSVHPGPPLILELFRWARSWQGFRTLESFPCPEHRAALSTAPTLIAAFVLEEQALLALSRELERAENPERALDRVRILELANKAHSLYVTQPPQEKAEWLRMVLSNCAVDAVRVYPTYRKPFDMIFERAKTGEW